MRTMKHLHQDSLWNHSNDNNNGTTTLQFNSMVSPLLNVKMSPRAAPTTVVGSSTLPSTSGASTTTPNNDGNNNKIRSLYGQSTPTNKASLFSSNGGNNNNNNNNNGWSDISSSITSATSGGGGGGNDGMCFSPPEVVVPPLNTSLLRISSGAKTNYAYELILPGNAHTCKFEVPKWAVSHSNKVGAALHCIKDGEVLQTLDLNNRRYTLFGRFPTCNQNDGGVPISLDHPSVSRIHAAIIRDEENVYLVDLDSSHGTFVSNKKIVKYTAIKLFDRSVIAFGLSSRRYIVRLYPLIFDNNNNNNNNENMMHIVSDDFVGSSSNNNNNLLYEDNEEEDYDDFDEDEMKESYDDICVELNNTKYNSSLISFNNRPKAISVDQISSSSSGANSSIPPKLERRVSFSCLAPEVIAQTRLNSINNSSNNSSPAVQPKTPSGVKKQRTSTDEFTSEWL